MHNNINPHLYHKAKLAKDNSHSLGRKRKLPVWANISLLHSVAVASSIVTVKPNSNLVR